MEYSSIDIILSIKNEEFKEIGFGSSRVVFDMNDGNVVKIARDIRGVAQNRAEYNISQSHKSDLFAKVIASSEDNRLLIMEKAEKIRNLSTVYKFYNVRSILSIINMDDFSADIVQHKLNKTDISYLSNWGLIDGVPKLIDYGLTSDIYNRYYRGFYIPSLRFKPIQYW